MQYRFNLGQIHPNFQTGPCQIPYSMCGGSRSKLGVISCVDKQNSILFVRPPNK